MSSLVRPQVVFIEEIEDADPPRFSGRFSARLEVAWRRVTDTAEGLTIGEAIEWGRARAGFVLVRFGRRVELWSAGATPHWSYPSWPPPDLPRLVPRPVPAADWRRDRGTGEGLDWAVTVRLEPTDVFVHGRVNDDRERWDEVVACAAAACLLGWDRELLDGFIADARAGEGPASGFSTFGSPAYRVYAVEHAPDALSAEAAVASRFSAPDGFRVHLGTRPADLSELAREPPSAE